MPLTIITKAEGWVTLGGGALPAITDFQVREGACLVTSNAPDSLEDGFLFEARGAGRDSWQAGAGRVVQVRTDSRAVIRWGVMV